MFWIALFLSAAASTVLTSKNSFNNLMQWLDPYERPDRINPLPEFSVAFKNAKNALFTSE